MKSKVEIIQSLKDIAVEAQEDAERAQVEWMRAREEHGKDSADEVEAREYLVECEEATNVIAAALKSAIMAGGE